MSNNIYPKFYKDWLETIKKNKNKILKKNHWNCQKKWKN